MTLLKNICLFSFAAVLIGTGVGCKKSYLDRLPSDQIPLDSLFKTTAGARTAVEGIHRLMYAVGDGETWGQKSIDLMADMMGEDMPISGYGAGWFYGSYIYEYARSGGGTPSYTWGYYYNIINNANFILQSIDAADGPQEDKDNIKGQALFYRAYGYYNLSLYYQQTYKGHGPFLGTEMDYIDAPCVPLYTSTTTEGKPRATNREVYAQIISDLEQSISLLQPVQGDKSQINQNIAEGLYARVALVMQNWPKAAEMANKARQGYAYMSASECLTGFNTSSNPEWMWASRMNNEQLGNAYSSFLSQMDYSSGGYSALGMQKIFYKQLANKIKATDVRSQWYYKANEKLGLVPYSQKKFKQRVKGDWSTDAVWMRAGEMALIEAEARAEMGEVSTAKTVLEELIKIRDAAYSAPTAQADLIKEIYVQRRIELWGEGFRLGDIKRQMATKRLSDNEVGLHRKVVTAANQNGDHNSAASDAANIGAYSRDFLFKIPSSELNAGTGVIQN